MKKRLTILNFKTAKQKVILLAVFLCSVNSVQDVYGQGKVIIDHKTKRFVNDESFLDRSKYFNIHQLTDLDDAELIAFKNTFNIPSDYRGSRLLDSPLKNHTNGVFPAVVKNFSGVRTVENRFASTAPNKLFYDATADYSVVNMTSFIDKATTYMTDFYRYQEAFVPKYIEPLNEPMIHSIDFYPEGRETPKKYITSKLDVIDTRICEFHRELAKKVHAAPELSNVKVAGFAGAFPEFEANNFGLWNSRYKKFIDIAGKDVDVLTLHLYDGVGVNNSGGRRSGSNVEAILDIMENYSQIKLNEVKPMAITEFGRLVANQPGWAEGNGVSNYGALESSQAVRSQIHMAMAFMERGGNIIHTIPFDMNKSNPNAQYARASLWNRVSTNPLTWEYTPRVNYFEIWKDVKGNRVQINT